MSAGHERQLLARLMSVVAGAAPIGACDDEELAAMVTLAERTRTIPTLAWRARVEGVVVPLPAGALELLERHTAELAGGMDPRLALQVVGHGSAKRSANLAATTRIVCDALAAAGVDAVPLKGAHVAAVGWLPSGARSMQDVDLLVRAEQGDQALGALCGLGWREWDSGEPWRQRAPHHLPALVRDGHAGSVELHVEPLTPRWRRVLSADDVWAAVQRGPGGLVMRDDHALAHTILHAMGSDGAWRGHAVPARALVDLGARARLDGGPSVDGTALAECFAAGGELPMLAGVASIATVAGAPIPFLEGVVEGGAQRAGERWARRTWWLAGHPQLARRVRRTAISVSQLNVEQLASHYGPDAAAHPRRAQLRYVMDRFNRSRSGRTT